MFAAWAIPLFGCVVVTLLAGIWQLWKIEVRVWFISKSAIHASAADLIGQHGSGAENAAKNRELEAWWRDDPFEAGRWEKVRKYIIQTRQADKT
jgi:hypothetical protein